jgi:cation:H+ antiporter
LKVNVTISEILSDRKRGFNMNYLILLVGFAFLIKGADWFVEGASSIARSFKIPPIIIGLTIVAFGTSAPEAAVSFTAALHGSNEIAIGNVVGSNIFNLLAVVGVSSIIYPLAVKKTTILKEFPFAILASLVLWVLSHDITFQGYPKNFLTKADGLILLALFGIFIYYLIEMALTSKEEMDVEEGKENLTVSKAIVLSLIGIIGIILGGNWVVDSASVIAVNLGMSENLVGLTIVAVGTSLPEFVTSIVAATKKESDIAIGNVLGSNLFNIFLVLGVSAIINPIAVNSIVFFDMIFMLIATVITFIFASTRRIINKPEGIILILMYIGYMSYIIMRN